MGNFRLSCQILGEPTEKDVHKFWSYVFALIKPHDECNSITVGLGSHDFFVVAGRDGRFISDEELDFTFSFKNSTQSWIADRTDQFDLNDSRFDEALDQSIALCKKWYFHWVKESGKRPAIKALREKVLGERELGVWKSLTEFEDDNTSEHDWLTGDRSVLKKSKKVLPTFRELTTERVKSSRRRESKRNKGKK